MQKTPPRAIYLTRREGQYFLSRDRKLENVLTSFCPDFEFATGLKLEDDEQLRIHVCISTLQQMPKYVEPPKPAPPPFDVEYDPPMPEPATVLRRGGIVPVTGRHAGGQHFEGPTLREWQQQMLNRITSRQEEEPERPTRRQVGQLFRTEES